MLPNLLFGFLQILMATSIQGTRSKAWLLKPLQAGKLMKTFLIKGFIFLLLSSSITSCYSSYVLEEYRPSACQIGALYWTETTPDIDPIDQACSDFKRRTGIEPNSLLKEVTVVVRKHKDSPGKCKEAHSQSCTYKVEDLEQTYFIVYKSGLSEKQTLWHEFLHLLLTQSGVPMQNEIQHRIMSSFGWL